MMSESIGTGARIVIAITGTISVFAAVVGAAITFFVTNASLGSQVTASTVRLDALQTTVSTLVESNTALTAQVASINGKVNASETSAAAQRERIAALRTDVVRLLSDLREIETQFCAS